jgi:hypothetical protein
MERLSDKLREYLSTCRGRTVNLKDIRAFLQIETGSKDDRNLRTLMSTTLVTERRVKPSGLSDGVYKVLSIVEPVKVYGRQRRPPIKIKFPRDQNSLEELYVADDIILREGDLILISGQSNFGKTGICLNFAGENIDDNPVLMGNEYTTVDKEPSSRFLNRLDNMDWVEWANGNGEDKFTLLPVFTDYAEYIRKDKINIIDWINLDEFYEISKVMEEIKRAVGKGVAIIAIQKSEHSNAGRGGQFTKDFADVEILLDQYGEREILMTMGKVKESNRRVSGRTFAFSLQKGVKVNDFREVVKCGCARGWRGTKKCTECDGTGFRDKQEI